VGAGYTGYQNECNTFAIERPPTAHCTDCVDCVDLFRRRPIGVYTTASAALYQNDHMAPRIAYASTATAEAAIECAPCVVMWIFVGGVRRVQ
jgi:hypothetical protein